jgi:hypothetical protein
VILKRARLAPAGLLTWLFWCVFNCRTPGHLKCQMPRQTKPGFFYFRVRFAGSPLMALSRQFSCISVCPLLDQSGERRILARDGLSANDPKRTSRWLHHSAAPRLRDAKRQADNLTKSGPMPESEWIGLAKRLPDRGIACGRSNDKKCRRNLENNRSWDDRMRRLLCVQEQPTVACVQPEACVQMP